MQDASPHTITKTVWIIAGEESGDLYGAELVRELRKLSPELTVAGMGGIEMRNAGVNILVDSTELGVVGFVEVLKKYPTFLRIFRFLVREARASRPDLIVLIDYPGFNLRFAKKMHKAGVPLIYYISPQVWAWGARRIPLIKSTIKKMLVIFPFEKDVYKDVGLDTVFVGHPLVEILRKKVDNNVKKDEKLILLLPGSRFSEVDRLVRPMVDVADKLHKKNPDFKFVVAAPRAGIADRIRGVLAGIERGSDLQASIQIVVGETEILMQKAVAGIAASGTVTVQSAILGLPLVVIYRVNPLTYMIGRWLVDVPYVTMINLIAGAEIYQEFLQNNIRASNLVPAVEAILPGGDRHEAVLVGMKKAVAGLEGPQNASKGAAQEIVGFLAAEG